MDHHTNRTSAANRGWPSSERNLPTRHPASAPDPEAGRRRIHDLDDDDTDARGDAPAYREQIWRGERTWHRGDERRDERDRMVPDHRHRFDDRDTEPSGDRARGDRWSADRDPREPYRAGRAGEPARYPEDRFDDHGPHEPDGHQVSRIHRIGDRARFADASGAFRVAGDAHRGALSEDRRERYRWIDERGGSRADTGGEPDDEDRDFADRGAYASPMGYGGSGYDRGYRSERAVYDRPATDERDGGGRRR